MITVLINIILGLIFLEAVLFFGVRTLRKQFQWLITEQDECPSLDVEALRKFYDYSHDPVLGWVRRPNTSGIEKGRNKNVRFYVDDRGARVNPYSGKEESRIAVFGDSYAFCRQVEDNETWPYHLSGMIKTPILNFGVGNYGIDQAILRYERTALPDSVKVVVLCFVPETICRVHSMWKHYLEFGNTFAFKPRFVLSEGILELRPNPMQNFSDFEKLRDRLPEIQKTDYFYKNKFKKIQFRFPYTVSFLRNIKRNSSLIGLLVMRKIARLLKWKSPWLEEAPFGVVMSGNIDDAHRLYKENETSMLLEAILLRFKKSAEERGHHPVVLVMPQLIDLKKLNQSKKSYVPFFEGLSQKMDISDMTAWCASAKPEDSLYAEDVYGGHFSNEGNRLVAGHLAPWLSQKFPEYFSNTQHLERIL